MAQTNYSTTSNQPKVSNPGAVRTLIKDWGFIPHHDELTVTVRENDESSEFVCKGDANFAPYRKDDVHESNLMVDKHDAVDIDGFIEALLPHLEEPLVIQTNSNTKLRYPMGAVQIVADPESGEHIVESYYDRREEFLNNQ